MIRVIPEIDFVELGCRGWVAFNHGSIRRRGFELADGREARGGILNFAAIWDDGAVTVNGARDFCALAYNDLCQAGVVASCIKQTITITGGDYTAYGSGYFGVSSVAWNAGTSQFTPTLDS